MALEKGTEEWQMFGEYFNLCKKHWDVKNTDEYWDMVIKETDEFYSKYKSILLAKKLALAFVDSLEARAKEMFK